MCWRGEDGRDQTISMRDINYITHIDTTAQLRSIIIILDSGNVIIRARVMYADV